MEVDASKCGIGAAMLQSDPIIKNSSTSEIPDNLHPISYGSKTLSETESNYSNIERELLGVVFAVTHFKHFTYGRPVMIISDHKPLASLFKKSLTSSSPHLSRMLLQILDYDLNIIYQEGSKCIYLMLFQDLVHTNQTVVQLCLVWTLLFMKLKHVLIFLLCL